MGNVMVAVVAVGMIAQKQQVISYLTGGLPQPLLPLPAVSAVQTRGAEDNDKRNRDQRFDKRKTVLFFHIGSVAKRGEHDERRILVLRGVIRRIRSVAARCTLSG